MIPAREPRVRLGEPSSHDRGDPGSRGRNSDTGCEWMANSIRGLGSCDDLAVGPAEGPDDVTGRAARPGLGGVVPRPGLFERLGASARVTVLSAPPGSGKTVLLRSWIGEPARAGRVAWVAVGRDEQDPQRFWLTVLGALRGTSAGSGLVRGLTAAPGLDGWAVVERLLKRAPPELRFVLATRHDLRLGLHRLRLEGELSEIRTADLQFTRAEARDLLTAAGVALPEPALAMLHERAEGWAAGLRLAALSLAGHEDPERFAAEFSGTERTVAEYLLAEVLERQPDEVRRLLLRTSILERVSGPLADALTGGSGGEQILQELEQANAFVVSLDVARSWFRYHHLFADLLQLELRRTAPGEVIALHQAAAGWFAGHGFVAEAIGHAQAAGDWALAARLLADHWPGLQLGGRAATVHVILAGFPAGVTAADAELATVAAADELAQGSLQAAERYLRLAARRFEGPASVPAGRRGQAQLLLGVVRLLLARQHGNLPAVAEEARRLQALTEAPDAVPAGLGEELRALALVNLGITEYWGGRLAEAEPHLDQGITLARKVGRPYLEFLGLAHRTSIATVRSSPYALAEELARQTIELARRHGWTDDPAVGIAYNTLAAGGIWRWQLEEAAEWVRRAERTLRAEADPMTAIAIRYNRALLELARGRDRDVLATFEAAERLARLLDAPDWPLMRARALRLHALVRLGEFGCAEQNIAEIGEQRQPSGEIRMALAALRIAQDDPHAATAALAPVLSGAVPVAPATW